VLLGSFDEYFVVRVKILFQSRGYLSADAKGMELIVQRPILEHEDRRDWQEKE
jgi:hypothetical protein